MEEDRILRCPVPGLRIVVSSSEPYELRVLIIEPTRKSKRLKPRVRIARDIAKFIIVYALGNLTRGDIDDQPRTAQVIRDDAKCAATLDHVCRHIVLTAVDEPADHCASPIQLSDRPKLVLIEETLGQHPVDFLPDAAVVAVDDVCDVRAVEEGRRGEIAEHIVLVSRG